MSYIILIIIGSIIIAAMLLKRNNNSKTRFQGSQTETLKKTVFCNNREELSSTTITPAPPRTTSKTLPAFKYDINCMRFLYHRDPDEDVYGIPIIYREAVSEDIMQVNALLEEASQKVRTVPDNRISKENIKFSPTEPLDDRFTMFIYTPYTKTGKIAKFPYYISFNLPKDFWGNEDLFGKVYFTKDNRIGKVWIVSWLNHKCFTINCTEKENRLQVTRIDVTTPDNYQKICLYNYNNKH